MGAVPTNEAPAVRDAVAALARAVARGTPDGLASSFDDLRAILERRRSIAIGLVKEGLLVDGAFVEHDFAARLYHDGIRTLCFHRGLTFDELSVFASIAASAEDREDAATELWKAALPHVDFASAGGYHMDEVAGPFVSAAVSDIAARTQRVLDAREVLEAAPPSPLWSDEQRALADGHDWPRVAGRAALCILRIVAGDYAGFDLEALQDGFTWLADRMLQRGAPQQLAQALVALKELPSGYRHWMAGWLSDPARLRFAVGLEGAGRLVTAWVALLPLESGAALVAVYPRAQDDGAREALARAIVARIDTCTTEALALFRSDREAGPLVAALAPLAAPRRIEFAAAAFENPNPAVAAQAVEHLARDPSAALRVLGPALQHESRELRIAAAVSLSGLPGGGERVARFFIDAIARPAFAEADEEEMAVFHRCLGKLGSNVGFTYLTSQLSLPQKKLFGRKRRTQAQLFAVEGLAEEGSPRSLRALDDAAKNGESKLVAEASQAAARKLRTRKLS
ncbi:MAG TPA: HEAT repeat domain-containing protein [Myxococcales bacterium]|jgi:hypothetical protein